MPVSPLCRTRLWAHCFRMRKFRTHRRNAFAQSGSAAQRAGATGQDGICARVCAVPRRSRAVDNAGSCRPIPRHLHAVSAPRRYRHTRSLQLPALPLTPRAQRADLRDHAADWGPDQANQFGSRSRAVDRIRERRPPPRPTTGTSWTRSACEASGTPRRTSTTTAQTRSKTWSITTWSSSSECA